MKNSLCLKGGDIREQFGVNQWLEQKKSHYFARLGKTDRHTSRFKAGKLGPHYSGRSS